MQDVSGAGVRDYFERTAKEFDAIYSGNKNAFMRWLDRVMRRDMYDRYRMALEECDDSAIRTVLDVGTGSGRFCMPLAEKKERVVGIDFSPSMIELARESARQHGVEDRCEFLVGDFLDMESNRRFDAILAIGLFDYIKAPAVFLEKMRCLAERKVVATFPTWWTWRVLLRWIRLRIHGCPVYFFTADKIRRLHDDAGLAIDRLERVGNIYFVVASRAKSSNA